MFLPVQPLTVLVAVLCQTTLRARCRDRLRTPRLLTLTLHYLCHAHKGVPYSSSLLALCSTHKIHKTSLWHGAAKPTTLELHTRGCTWQKRSRAYKAGIESPRWIRSANKRCEAYEETAQVGQGTQACNVLRFTFGLDVHL